LIAGRQTIVDTLIVRKNAVYTQALGGWIRDSIGSGATIYPYSYFPDILLPAEARNTSNSWQPGQPFPDVVVAGPRSLPALVRLRRPIGLNFGAARLMYVPVCPNETGSTIAIYVSQKRANDFDCVRLSRLTTPLISSE
jgi:hypothetical protein